MTTKQLKQAVVKALDEMPDEVLADLLEYMQSLQGKDKVAFQHARNLRKILSEDSELLKALAQ